MPYIVRKNKNQPTYRVINAITKQIHAKASTKQNAERQVKLMNMLDIKRPMIEYRKNIL